MSTKQLSSAASGRAGARRAGVSTKQLSSAAGGQAGGQECRGLPQSSEQAPGGSTQRAPAALSQHPACALVLF